jgi:hypothetical protein
MPTRIIREGILTSERINKLTERAELFYRRLMSVVDDYGRFPANPTLLRSSCYPLKFDSVKEDSIKKHLAEAEGAGLIVLYTVDSKAYLEIQDFGQRINGKPKFPGKDQEVTCSPGESPGFPGNSRLDGGVGEGVCGGVLSNPKGLEVGIPSDPSETPDGKEDESKRRKNCPVTRIVALYHECLPNNPTVEKVTDARAGYIRQRWLDDLPTLDAWKNYFEYVGKSAFLTGRTQGRDGKAPFVADIEFLTKPASFTKTAEGKYHR